MTNAWHVIEKGQPPLEPVKKDRCPERLIRRCVLEAGHEGRHIEDQNEEVNANA